MATIGQAVTLLDLQKRYDGDDNIDTIIELLRDDNEILEDMLWVEGNLLTGHKTTVRTGLPEGTWRKFNEGVAATKSKTRQVTDETAMLETYAKIDKALADLNGNSAAWRQSEDIAFVQGLNNQMAENLWYGDSTVNPERFTGFNPRYLTPSADEDLSGFNIIDGGGTGSDNTSIYLVGWGANSVHGIYPKGSKAGLSIKDLGEDTLTDANGNEYQGYRTHFKWDCGLTVRDWRYVVRIANIDVSNLVADSSAVDLIRQMVNAIERMPSMAGVRPAFYMHRTVKTHLRHQRLGKAAGNLSFDNVEGKQVMSFDGIPVRRSDALTKTEAQITGTFGS